MKWLINLEKLAAFWLIGSMDKKIEKIQKLNKKEGEKIRSLKKADKKRDRACAVGAKILKSR